MFEQNYILSQLVNNDYEIKKALKSQNRSNKFFALSIILIDIYVLAVAKHEFDLNKEIKDLKKEKGE